MPGSYRIYAVAVDNGGNRVMSDVITVSTVPGTEAPAVTLNDLNGTHFVEKPFICTPARRTMHPPEG